VSNSAMEEPFKVMERGQMSRATLLLFEAERKNDRGHAPDADGNRANPSESLPPKVAHTSWDTSTPNQH